jgi:hypothetical protein
VPVDRDATLTSAAPSVRLKFTAAAQPVRITLGKRHLQLRPDSTRSVTVHGRQWSLRADGAVHLVAARIET